MFLSLPLFCADCASNPALPKSVRAEEKKAYFGPTPIHNTPAYQAFLLSSKSETAKLNYLLDRIRAAKDLVYYYQGDRYSWLEAYTGATWLLWHDHKIGEDARVFIRKEALRFQDPLNPAVIQYPDRSRHLIFDVMMNDLDLLDTTERQETSAE